MVPREVQWTLLATAAALHFIVSLVLYIDENLATRCG